MNDVFVQLLSWIEYNHYGHNMDFSVYSELEDLNYDLEEAGVSNLSALIIIVDFEKDNRPALGQDDFLCKRVFSNCVIEELSKFKQHF